ncbi:MAG: carboxypeptidase M32 [Desulforhopalus sp.]
MSTYDILRQRFEQLAHLSHALTFLQWDQMVMMPPGGNESRAQAIAELTSIHHELLSADETGELLTKAADETTDSELRRSLEEMERQYRHAAALPADLVKAKSLAGSRCEHGWRSQRKKNDWPGFLKNFREVVRLARQEAQARCSAGSGKFPTPYDAMLDLHCAGDSSSFIAAAFATLKDNLPGMVQQIVDRQRGESPPTLQGSYPVPAQRHMNRELMQWLGFDFNCGRADESVHPFSTGCRGDQRITTRFRESDFLEALMATAHETGHASYESGLPVKWEGLPIGRARNMCIHESQSLLFEKQLFLAKPFLSFFTEKIHKFLPETTSYSEEAIWKAATRVQPSFIRVEADEVSYPLHIVLRYEIESALINGTLEAEEIPDIWDAKMRDYFGLSTAGNYSDRCLQDIHWTDGSFGYFPSYTIGALNSAQLSRTLRNHFPNWQEKLASGDVYFARNWLAESIWSKGSTLDSQELIRSATGEKTSSEFFLQHIRQRYLEEEY